MEPGEPGPHRYAPTSDYRRLTSSVASIDTPASASSSAAVSRFDDADRRPRDAAEQTFQDGYTLTTASTVPATAPYRPHPPASSYSSGYPSGAIASSLESRRTSDESDSMSTHRRSQPSDRSLPSLHEALSSTPLGASAESRESIRSLPPPHSFTTRPPPVESIPSFPASARSTLSARANVPPPLPLIDRTQPASQSYIGRDRDADFRQTAEPALPQLSGSYPQYPQQHLPTSQHGPPIYSQPGQRPPGQLPLPSFPPPSPPRQPNSAVLSPLNHGRPPYYPDEEFARNKHDGTLSRPFDAYPYMGALNKIALSSRIIFNFAEAFDAAAREPNGGAPLPSRVPNESEITVMMENAANIRQCLDDVKGMIRHSRAHSERARDMAREAGARRPLEEEDVHMYSDASATPQQQHHPQHPHHPLHHQPPYTLAEVKKRRGRAAPPGRCHSCNRVDTPEWRRGPDGARTLCNACGLHYAKLERKRQSEQRSIRPKPIHDS